MARPHRTSDKLSLAYDPPFSKALLEQHTITAIAIDANNGSDHYRTVTDGDPFGCTVGRLRSSLWISHWSILSFLCFDQCHRAQLLYHVNVRSFREGRRPAEDAKETEL